MAKYNINQSSVKNIIESVKNYTKSAAIIEPKTKTEIMALRLKKSESIKRKLQVVIIIQFIISVLLLIERTKWMN